MKSKLTSKQQNAVRLLYTYTDTTVLALVERFEVGRSTIGRALVGVQKVRRPHKLISHDLSTHNGVCKTCGPVQLHCVNKITQGHQYWVCPNKAAQLQRARTGFTPELYDKLLEKQQGLCAICGEHMGRTHSDHDHVTGKPRGLLCHKCNMGLGLFRDSSMILRAAAEYLMLH